MHLVSPKLPTILDHHQTTVDLPGIDLLLVYVDNVHVLPGKIGLERFNNALSDTLQLYPHAAGQLRCQNGRWFIELTNTPVPVDVSYIQEKDSSSVLQNDWVIQEDLSSLLHHQPVDANPINGTVPLVRFKLTFFMDETCIGISWHHALADGIGLFRFTHTLSQFYQDKAITPDRDAYTFTYVDDTYVEANKSAENLQWRFSGEELRRLHTITNSSGQQALTIQDCLTAYLVTVLNRCREEPIRIINNVVSYRKVIAPFVDENVAGNASLFIFTQQLPLDMVGIANAIRTSILRSRDAQELEYYLSTASDSMLTAANLGKWIDWCSAHFGFPDGSKFHTIGVYNIFVRPFISNPVKGVDGIWHSRQDSIDVSMGVSAGLKSRMLDILARGVE
ncbi:hypothetical protein J3A83DRAFT_4209798 [Scleroderma citrinum]